MASSSRRTIAVLLLAAVLLAPWAASAEPATRATPVPWDLLAHWWNAVTTLWGDNGCSVDPFGRCRDDLEAGCSVDPFGHCRDTNATPPPAENLDNGCHIDPYGTCRHGNALPAPTENLDNGCSMDPYGGCRPGS